MKTEKENSEQQRPATATPLYDAEVTVAMEQANEQQARIDARAAKEPTPGMKAYIKRCCGSETGFTLDEMSKVVKEVNGPGGKSDMEKKKSEKKEKAKRCGLWVDFDARDKATLKEVAKMRGKSMAQYIRDALDFKGEKA